MESDTPMRRFWGWYERHYAVNVGIAAGLFLLQIVHLAWLTGDVLWTRATGEALFTIDGPFAWFLYAVDYTEIPALVSVSLVYVNELRKGFAWRPFAYLLFLNSQWLHIFWITDEFVVNEFQSAATVSTLPAWLAWLAILIDYLELPVISDTLRRTAGALRERRFAAAAAAVGRE